MAKDETGDRSKARLGNRRLIYETANHHHPLRVEPNRISAVSVSNLHAAVLVNEHHNPDEHAGDLQQLGGCVILDTGGYSFSLQIDQRNHERDAERMHQPRYLHI